MDDKLLKKIEFQATIIRDTLYNIALYRALSFYIDKVKKNCDIYYSFINNTMCMICIRWCNLFGAYSEENHWTQTVSDENQNFIRNEILFKVCGGEDGWNDYFNTIKDFRDYYVAHFKEEGFSKVVPNLDNAKNILIMMLNKLSEIYEISSLSTELFYENTLEDLKDFVSNKLINSFK